MCSEDISARLAPVDPKDEASGRRKKAVEYQKPRQYVRYSNSVSYSELKVDGTAILGAGEDLICDRACLAVRTTGDQDLSFPVFPK